jgi:hypothetical protein
MKAIKNKFIIGIFGLALLGLNSCSDDLADINKDLNDPEVVPTNMIFSESTRSLMDTTRDEWWSGRMTLPWVQYSAQLAYTEEDSYQYRDSQTTNGWAILYRNAQNLKSVIDFCESEDTKDQMAGYGNLDNQIAASRIMLVYIFDQLATHFGDIPYWSYGTTDADFQALQIDEYLQPKYAPQSKIFPDLLKELKEASEQINTSEVVFTSGDHIYGGDATKWKKFANSLRLRIANRIKAVYPEANSHISDAIASGVFSSNADNAVHAFYASSTEGNPFWQSYFVENRTDFAVNGQFIKLLKGVNGDYGVDPRLQKMAAPIGNTPTQVTTGSYEETDDLTQYVGMPYGLPATRVAANGVIGLTSFVSSTVLTATFGEVLMEYSEVEFILSEVNSWSQSNYEAGVRASMEKWGVAASDINAYVASLPAANMEHVITQKYIALFMQPQEAWNEYRRTGYPDGDVLLLPGGTGYEINGDAYTFVPLMSGNVVATDIPHRLRYPITELNTNSNSYAAAVQAMGGSDEINVKLWWDVN